MRGQHTHTHTRPDVTSKSLESRSTFIESPWLTLTMLTLTKRRRQSTNGIHRNSPNLSPASPSRPQSTDRI